MMPVADSRPAHLREQRLRVAQQEILQRAGAVKLLLQPLARKAKAVTAALHDGATRRGLAAHEQRDPDHPLEAYDGDFCRRTVFHDVEQRDDGGRGKVHVPLSATGLIENVSKRQFDHFEVLSKPVHFCRG